jgi:hypothetical protein
MFINKMQHLYIAIVHLYSANPDHDTHQLKLRYRFGCNFKPKAFIQLVAH